MRGLSGEVFRAKVQIGDGKFTADVKLSQERIEIVGLRKYSDPAAHDKAVEELEQGTSSIDLHASLGFTKEASSAAIVRSAYLMMFYYFGYGYIRFDLLDRVRNYLAAPSNDSALTRSVITLPALPVKPVALSILQRPKELQCYFVTFDLSTTADRFLGVILPGLYPDGLGIYNKLSQYNIANTECTFTQIEFRQEFLENPDLKDYAFQIWHKLTG